MPLTRAQTEAILLGRCRGLMDVAGMNSQTSGTNPDLNGPILDALFGMGLIPADPLNITDADLAAVDGMDEMLDRAEYRLLRDIAGSLTVTDITVGPRREALSQLAANLGKMIERMREHLVETYGVGAGTLQAGSISLDFQEDGEPPFFGEEYW